MSNSRKTSNLIPITDGDGFETEADSGIIRLFVGSQGDALNWRTGQSRPLKEGEIRPFPLTHPNLIVTAEPAAIPLPGEPMRSRKNGLLSAGLERWRHADQTFFFSTGCFIG